MYFNEAWEVDHRLIESDPEGLGVADIHESMPLVDVFRPAWQERGAARP